MSKGYLGDACIVYAGIISNRSWKFELNPFCGSHRRDRPLKFELHTFSGFGAIVRRTKKLKIINEVHIFIIKVIYPENLNSIHIGLKKSCQTRFSEHNPFRSLETNV